MNTENSINVPVGKAVLGRILNAQGDAIDQREAFGSEVQRVPLSRVLTSGEPLPDQMLETGIKPIDLLSPLPRGGVVALLSEQGLGKLVLMEEIIHNFIAHQHGYIVFIATGESTYEATELRDIIRDIEAEDRAVMIFEHHAQTGGTRSSDSQQEERMLRTGLTIATYFAEHGDEVLLVVGKDVMSRDNHATLGELKHIAAAKGITTFLFEPLSDMHQLEQSGLLQKMDGQIVFSNVLKKLDLWPVIDRLSTHSRLLEGNILDTEHVEVAQQVRQLLGRYTTLQEQAEAGQLSSSDESAWKRAQRVQFFLTQPFFVAEAYTDLPGAYLPISQTIQSFKDLLEGRYDDVPAQAFYFVGTIEQALAKAGK